MQVTPGVDAGAGSPSDIGAATLKALLRTVPPAVPGELCRLQPEVAHRATSPRFCSAGIRRRPAAAAAAMCGGACATGLSTTFSSDGRSQLVRRVLRCRAGVHFLSGGQSEEQASANLNAMNALAGSSK